MIEQMDFKLYRRRVIPSELILLKEDIIVKHTEEVIITRWSTLRPKPDFHHGCSCYFLREGIKMSKFLQEDGSLLCWYCDIVDYSYDREDNALTVTDLLADVIIYPDGTVKVADLDELAQALEQGSITQKLLLDCLHRLSWLLDTIYTGRFHLLQAELNNLGL